MLYPASHFFRRDPFRRDPLRQDPFSLMRQFAEGMDPSRPVTTRPRGFPAVNMRQDGDTAEVTTEIPGVAADDIHISVKENVLTLSGERKPPETATDAVWHRRERSFGKFSRSLQLPFNADPNNVEAKLQNGVLNITLHRPETEKARRIVIKAA